MASGVPLKFLAYGTGDAQLRTGFMPPVHSGAAVIAHRTAVRTEMDRGREHESDLQLAPWDKADGM